LKELSTGGLVFLVQYKSTPAKIAMAATIAITIAAIAPPFNPPLSEFL
jgi:hypothetical protein